MYWEEQRVLVAILERIKSSVAHCIERDGQNFRPKHAHTLRMLGTHQQDTSVLEHYLQIFRAVSYDYLQMFTLLAHVYSYMSYELLSSRGSEVTV